MKLPLLALALFVGLRVGQAAPEARPHWLSDFAEASSLAAEHDRPMLLNFTGSDWCVWCHRLRDEVFQTPFFAKYAAESLVLVELDFPRQNPLPAPLKAQNDALAKKFGVEGYPTIILLDAQGKELTRLGYMQGGPKTFVRELKRHLTAPGQPAATSQP